MFGAPKLDFVLCAALQNYFVFIFLYIFCLGNSYFRGLFSGSGVFLQVYIPVNVQLSSQVGDDVYSKFTYLVI